MENQKKQLILNLEIKLLCTKAAIRTKATI